MNEAKMMAMDDITPEKLRRLADTLSQFVKVAELVSSLTPTKLDDESVAAVKRFVAELKPYLDQDWPAQLANIVLGLFKKGDSAPAERVRALEGIAKILQGS